MITIIELNENNHKFKGRNLVVITRAATIKSEDEAKAYAKHVYNANLKEKFAVEKVTHLKIK